MFRQCFRQALAFVGDGESDFGDDFSELPRSKTSLDVIENGEQRKTRGERAGEVLEKREQLCPVDFPIGDLLGTAARFGLDEKRAFASELLLDEDLAWRADPALFDCAASGQRLVPEIRHKS